MSNHIEATARERSVTIPSADVELEGTIGVPSGASGVVVFAHGSGSSRFSPRNRHVAHVLREAGLATLLLDLVSPDEEEDGVITGEHRFDIDFLAERVEHAIDWLAGEPETETLAVGLFGASTGAAAALVSAAERPIRVGAVVSRGGRPDLADQSLPDVECPTLLIVGGRDDVVLDLNERARDHMRCAVRLEIIPGATHLFEEPGALDQVARLARDWFVTNLSSKRVGGT